jgi:hypothetical protein
MATAAAGRTHNLESVLLATGTPTLAERTTAVEAVPCVSNLNRSAGIARAILDNQASTTSTLRSESRTTREPR